MCTCPILIIYLLLSFNYFYIPRFYFLINCCEIENKSVNKYNIQIIVYLITKFDFLNLKSYNFYEEIASSIYI